jgi:hypothetical protein
VWSAQPRPARSWRQPADYEWPYLGDSLEIPIDVDHPQAVLQGDLGDQEVGDWRAVPHAVVMGKVSLEAQRPVEKVRRRSNYHEIRVQVGLQVVVVPSGSGGVQLLELSHLADE